MISAVNLTIDFIQSNKPFPNAANPFPALFINSKVNLPIFLIHVVNPLPNLPNKLVPSFVTFPKFLIPFILPLIPLLNNLNPFDIELIAFTIFENANSKGNIPATNPAIITIVFLVPSLKPLNLLIILVNMPINGVKHKRN